MPPAGDLFAFGETPKWEKCGGCDNCGARAGVGKQCERRGAVSSCEGDFVSVYLSVIAEIRSCSNAGWGAGSRSGVGGVSARMAAEYGAGNKVPAYIILHDSTLEELCRRKPANLGQLKQVPGLAKRRPTSYGAEILQALRNFGEGARARADG